MATTPGFLTDWPWKHLGNFKYVILGPWICESVYCFVRKEEYERDWTNFLILPFLVSRMVHNQVWISFSRYRTAKGNNRIVDKGIEFDQVDRENNWDDQIILSGILLYVFNTLTYGASNLALWRSDGVLISIFLHAGPVEFLYYWLHRALHHHYLYSRYHSHHHSSIVTQPITSVIHPFAEHIAYFLLFAIPTLTTVFTGTASLVSLFGYITYIDLMNNMGHCNFEFIPNWIFSIFPPLKYTMYTPSLGFSSLASMPENHKWYIWFMWPLTLWTMIINCIYGRIFILERNSVEKFNFQSWAIPRYNLQYLLKWQSQAINSFIEDAILRAEEKGSKVLSLGLLNQADEELNRNGEVYIERHPKLKMKVVDGSSLAVAVVLNSIPKGTTQVLLRGNLTKVAFSLASALSQRGIQVATLYKSDYEKLKLATTSNFVLSNTFDQKIWVVGDGLTEEEQMKAGKGTHFFPFSQLPPKKARHDCFYHHPPAMLAPPSLQNMHACENWLPRRAMSAPRVAGIVHALEGWNVHECGDKMIDVDQIWEASINHGFKPLAFAE
uniref:Sterol desaturase n=1 Tax=Solanum tuberosum TaxID=4113 RepID=M1CPL7_SOLTU